VIIASSQVVYASFSLYFQLIVRPHRRKGEVRALYHHKVRGGQYHKNMAKLDSARDAQQDIIVLELK
jgi:hypothetical protein